MVAINDARAVKGAHRAKPWWRPDPRRFRPDHPWRDLLFASVITFGLWLTRPFRRRRR